MLSGVICSWYNNEPLKFKTYCSVVRHVALSKVTRRQTGLQPYRLINTKWPKRTFNVAASENAAWLVGRDAEGECSKGRGRSDPDLHGNLSEVTLGKKPHHRLSGIMGTGGMGLGRQSLSRFKRELRNPGVVQLSSIEPLGTSCHHQWVLSPEALTVVTKSIRVLRRLTLNHHTTLTS